jgi:predicted RNA-binding Zn ribbon-like protein
MKNGTEIPPPKDATSLRTGAAGHPAAGAAADGYVFELSGGHLALDFANTASRRPDPAQNRERLTDFGRLVTWGEQAGLLTEKAALRLRAGAKDHARSAAAALKRAVTLREAIYELFAAFARGVPVPEPALATLNAEIPDAFSCLHLGACREGFEWSMSCGEEDAAPILAPVVRAAAELLTSPDVARVRECDLETCSWLFLDRSKNATRRWCDMAVCGNRAKARRHYAREKKASRRGKGAKAGPAR